MIVLGSQREGRGLISVSMVHIIPSNWRSLSRRHLVLKTCSKISYFFGKSLLREIINYTSKVISYASKKKRKNEEKKNILENNIQQLESNMSLTDNKTVFSPTEFVRKHDFQSLTTAGLCQKP